MPGSLLGVTEDGNRVRAAEYPERRCREAVYNAVGMAYGCEIVDLHPGPCCSLSVSNSVSRRQQWQDSNPDWRKSIGSDTDIVS